MTNTTVLSRVSDLLGSAEENVLDPDSVGIMRALGEAAVAATLNPAKVVEANARWFIGSASAAKATMARAMGADAEAPVPVAKGDRRFADPTYQVNPAYFYTAQQYLLFERAVAELVEAAGLTGELGRKARFGSKFITDMISPSNNLFGNPAALKKAFDTGGKSVVRGMRNMLHDVRHNGGWPSQVDKTGFEVGVNMAATPGEVVYRSDLIELIQYRPQTDNVYAVPLLFCPPWINKYYIMDLAPGKSLIEWAVQHGHTCFAISYRNPTKDMSGLGFRDYMFDGPLDAVRVIKEITGSETVNTVSVCLGGTLSALGLAYNALRDDRSIASATFLNTHTDFTEPGVLGVFTDEATVAGLEKQMNRKGYLDSAQMARTFSALRANDLVFSYLVNNWLLGEKPPSFDLLAWNDDSTRMPARMHSEYLRSCYLNNQFARGEFEVEGQKLDPSLVDADTYVLAAIDDHIVPWKSGYKTTHILGGKSRFVLSTSGHIAGIVNPPSPKAKYWTNDLITPDSAEWKAGAKLHEGTWWEDWSEWIAERGGPKVPAPETLGSAEYPPLEAAPGSYVRAA